MNEFLERIEEEEREKKQRTEDIKKYLKSIDHVTIVPDDIPKTYNKK